MLLYVKHLIEQTILYYLSDEIPTVTELRSLNYVSNASYQHLCVLNGNDLAKGRVHCNSFNTVRLCFMHQPPMCP